ncbi:RloB family protein [Pseudogulbenkiania ferrooxidans]|uniref:Abortive phage resistance protein n=1 Tax=Pseudogulbenkiania ferrooxidans 2002 TaxID=279714 RepID=B9Z8H9_9NEIS|nr:RloB family protein [Pseudogulbenkiania ferrooxidans]EEG06917.1 conserved hypothetical protein [Pseudogulbenkiania ferrooxidans 2002]
MPKKKSAVQRKLQAVLHIYCEGAKTEPNYINSYLQETSPGNRRKNVIRVEPTKKNTPVQLVDEAVKHKKSPTCPKSDIFWVVFDRESVAKYPDALHAEASQKAKSNGINIAISNVCFELWLLLHFQENGSPYSSYADLISNSKLKEHLKEKGIHEYDKANASIFDSVKGGLDSARKAAKKMNAQTLESADPQRTKPYQLNPFTEIHLLLDAIDNFE